ncbi:MAG: DUF3500 domain-containing protein [Acidobacteriota bacterium]|nr:DUF3500 domain-containing protein [Acidobacteriota bacterium]
MARTIFNVVCLVVLLGTITLSQQPQDPASAMSTAAIRFLDSLTDEQEAAARFPFDDEDRFDWHFIPRERKGVPLKAMTGSQRATALDLVRTGLSEDGFTKAEVIRQLEQILFELEGRAIRDPDLYFFMVFGEPSNTGTWGWRYEGHHISQNWTIVNGSAVATSPQFFGSNPAEVRDGPRAGLRVLGSEEDQARSLLASLNDVQRAAARVSDEAPSDILTRAQRKVTMLEDFGVSHADLDSDQQSVVWSIIEEYATVQPDPIAKARLATIQDAGLDHIKFVWMGGAAKGEPHYYRIQGPTFLIEYDNTQGSANHVHSVWRDFNGDFGRDLLAAHYRQYEHGPLNADD